MRRSYWFGILVIIIIGFFIGREFWQRWMLENRYRYTVGTITSLTLDTEGRQAARYNYSYRNKEYTGGVVSLQLKHVFIGERFFVRFVPFQPSNARIELEKRVPGEVIVPDTAWKEIPEEILRKIDYIE